MEHYAETLDEAARKNTSMLEVLSMLVGGEASARAERAMQRRIAQARLPKRKTLEDYKIFDVDNTLATAMIDRLIHHGEAIMIEGKSYRTNDDNESDS